MKDEYGYNCACGRHHHYPPYVIAHQDVELIHTCKCGRKNSILGLVAVIGSIPVTKQNILVALDEIKQSGEQQV